jgi:hypothetical protein
MAPSIEAMQAGVALSARRAVPGSAVLALGLGLALYQMTALVLGPPSSRELHVSLILPKLDLQQMAEPAMPGLDLVIASRVESGVVAIIRPMVSSHRVAVQRNQAQATSLTVTSATPAPVAPPVVTPLPVAANGQSEKSHYHDAGERGLRLGRRR